MAQIRDHHLERPAATRLSPDNPRYDDIIRRHAEATEAGQPCYSDPATGLSVFTASFHVERGYCCDSGCRHCPFVLE